MTADPTDPIARFRALLGADAALQRTLGAIEDSDAFVARCIEHADRHGLTLTADALEATLKGAPAGMGRLAPVPTLDVSAPQLGWLPIGLTSAPYGPAVDWAYFGDRPLSEPFFEDSMRTAARQPMNRFVRLRTPLTDLAAGVAALPHLEPSGFIFHMSRCGSTLVAQMLGRSGANISLSEAAALDEMAQLGRALPGLSPVTHIALVRAMIAAFGQVRRPTERRYVVKLDSWHILALPLFRTAFPDVPWVFLYREPTEVVVSQMRQPGVQVVPEFIDPALYGLDAPYGNGLEDYCARVLGAICASAVAGHAAGGGLLINYRELPGALFSRILPHFGIDASPEEYAAMAGAARFDAKQPQMSFAADLVAKRDGVTDAIRSACAAHLDGPYRRLEALRIGETAVPA